jgi:CRP/FNR family cyclic AMP-dependent transcriptional regulator
VALRSGSRPLTDLDDAVVAAIAASHLRSLPDPVIAELFGDTSQLHIPASSTVHREGATSAHVEMVLKGLIRVYVQSVDGRMMTVRYCRPGALIGVASLFAPRFSLPATIQAVTETDLLVLRASLVKRMAERDVRVANALLADLSERVLSFIAEIPGSVFASIRRRVARHLLDLASEGREGSALVAGVSQQDLADAVGTVREVVVRALRELRQEGMISTGRHGILILDADRLAGVSLGENWNPGSKPLE